MKLKILWETLVEIIDEWSDDKAPKLAASLSFYTMFSLAPVLLIAIALAGFIYGNDAAEGRIVSEVQSMVGREGAVIIQTALKNTSDTQSGIIATIIGFVTLVIGATVIFIELQDSLNTIWKVRQKSGQPIRLYLRNRMVSFSMVIGFGVLLFLLLLISTAISALSGFVERYLIIPPFLLHLMDIVISFLVVTILFGMIYKILPDVHIAWRDVRIGAIVTSILFILGKYLISLYLAHSTTSSVYGAAGSLALLLIWIYYTAQILFLGAEFTYIYTKKFGSGIHPKSYAEVITCIPEETIERKGKKAPKK